MANDIVDIGQFLKLQYEIKCDFIKFLTPLGPAAAAMVDARCEESHPRLYCLWHFFFGTYISPNASQGGFSKRRNQENDNLISISFHMYIIHLSLYRDLLFLKKKELQKKIYNWRVIHITRIETIFNAESLKFVLPIKGPKRK